MSSVLVDVRPRGAQFAVPPPGAVAIRLSNGTRCWVDAADAPALRAFRWHAMAGNTTTYAWRRDGRNTVYMHRQLTGLAGGRERVVDHVDGNGLNNTRRNLRVCTCAQNQANGGPRPQNRNGLRGVTCLRGSPARFRATIRVDGHRFHLGIFPTARDAAHAYDRAAREHYGEFARCNFPRPGREVARG